MFRNIPLVGLRGLIFQEHFFRELFTGPPRIPSAAPMPLPFFGAVLGLRMRNVVRTRIVRMAQPSTLPFVREQVRQAGDLVRFGAVTVLICSWIRPVCEFGIREQSAEIQHAEWWRSSWETAACL